MPSPDRRFLEHLGTLRACRLCAGVIAPPIAQPVTAGRVYLRGQAPGPREVQEGRAFCGPAGRTLFRWFASIGVEEQVFRERVFMGALIRCFPGKNEGGQGDRRPSRDEIGNCRAHFDRELELLRPDLVLLVGGMAIDQLLPRRKLDEVVGRTFDLERNGQAFTALPLPHPSGLSRWLQGEPGKSLLRQALDLLAEQPAWRETFGG